MLKHPLAVLRTTLGMGQKEMAELLGKSTRTVQAIELGQLALGERLAVAVASKTGVSLAWLEANDVNAPIRSSRGEPYTKEDFERAQARQPGDTFDATMEMLQSFFDIPVSLAIIARASLAAYKAGDSALFSYRLTTALKGPCSGWLSRENTAGGYGPLYTKWLEDLQAGGKQCDSPNAIRKFCLESCAKILTDYAQEHLKLAIERHPKKPTPLPGAEGSSKRKGPAKRRTTSARQAGPAAHGGGNTSE
jgi:transcriptional regulator with XRE-family HTH domain